MNNKTLDLRKVFGMIITYNVNQQPDSPHRPFEVVTELYPGGKSAIHVHPNQEEIYEIKEGEMEVYLHNHWKLLKAGERVTIPKGTVHAFRNAGKKKVVALNVHNPGLRFGQMLEETQQLIKEGKLTGTSGFKNIIYMCMQMLKYNDVMVPVKPPLSLVKVMAKMGKRLGYRID